jgi:autophagy-related protein 5
VGPEEAWLSFEGVPLKWHYPFGLLYDLYSGREPFSAGQDKGVQGNESRAWKLTVHFSDYPVDQLVKLDADGKHLHDLYINSVKEVRLFYPLPSGTSS